MGHGAPGGASSSSSGSSKGKGRGLSSSLAARAKLFDHSAGLSGEEGPGSSGTSHDTATTPTGASTGGEEAASSSSSTRERARRHAARLALNAKMAAAFSNNRDPHTHDDDDDPHKDHQETAFSLRAINANPNGIAAARAMFAAKPNTVPKTPDMLGSSGFHPVVHSKSFHTATIGNGKSTLPVDGGIDGAEEATSSDKRLLSLVLDDPENSPLLYIEVCSTHILPNTIISLPTNT